MPKLNNRVPKYCRHRGSGQAVVALSGQDIYVGQYGSPASRAKYDRLIAEWIAAGRRLPTDPNAITIAEVVAAFRRHAQTYYGADSKAAANIDGSLRPVVKLYGRTAANEFGPLRLKTVREQFISGGRVRANINRHITRIRGVFKWAAENELIPANVFHGLMAVRGLRRGKSGAVEGEPVKPVPVEHVEAVIPHVSPQVVAMIRLQLLTGMRPGEVTIMRGCDLDTTGNLWLYRPSRHKTQSYGHERLIYLGPKAQEVIRPFLNADLQAYLFSPAEAEGHRRALLHAQRKTPMNEGNTPGSNRLRRPQHRAGDVYTVGAYYNAVRRGCYAAFPPPPELLQPNREVELAAWRREHRRHIHQLRHTAATELRKEFGVEAAQVILGHRTLTTTQLYAEKNVEAAKRVMAAIG
jgi:integrase